MAGHESDGTRGDNSSVIESAEVFSPIFSRKVEYEQAKRIGSSPGFQRLRQRVARLTAEHAARPSAP